MEILRHDSFLGDSLMPRAGHGQLQEKSVCPECSEEQTRLLSSSSPF
jgi:hypothetical protein